MDNFSKNIEHSYCIIFYYCCYLHNSNYNIKNYVILLFIILYNNIIIKILHSNIIIKILYCNITIKIYQRLLTVNNKYIFLLIIFNHSIKILPSDT